MSRLSEFRAVVFNAAVLVLAESLMLLAEVLMLLAESLMLLAESLMLLAESLNPDALSLNRFVALHCFFKAAIRLPDVDVAFGVLFDLSRNLSLTRCCMP